MIEKICCRIYFRLAEYLFRHGLFSYSRAKKAKSMVGLKFDEIGVVEN
ncbi:hypothetical protein RV03_GL000650 [Enterococcus gallinarum]|nr:hypothetical protein RV03_GL000650 [Enterococcus gallinarum]